MKRLFVCIIIHSVMASCASAIDRAINRDDFISLTTPYIVHSWTMRAENLYDRLEPFSEDDRRTADKNNENYRNLPCCWWPFENEATYPSVAYAFGNKDTPALFDAKRGGTGDYVGQKWIVGANDINWARGVPSGYKGYAGIDCANFVGRLVGINGNIGTVDIKRYAIEVENPLDLRKGDVLNIEGSHVVMLGANAVQSGTSYTTIYHAAGWRYGSLEQVRRVIKEDNVECSVVGTAILLRNRSQRGAPLNVHQPYTFFPVFDDYYPHGSIQANNMNPIGIGAYFKSKTGLSVLELKLKNNNNEMDETANCVVHGSDGRYTVSFRPSQELSSGNCIVNIKVKNDYGLVEEKSFCFSVEVDRDKDKDDMDDAWEKRYKDGGLDPNNDDDGDGLTNLQEYNYGTNPLLVDTDGGGVSDGAEMNQGTNPHDPSDDYGGHSSGTDRMPHPPAKGDSIVKKIFRKIIEIAKDPNEMSGPEGQVSAGQSVTYTVSFENVGQGTAYGVYIKDIFPEYLDTSALSVINCKRVDYENSSETSASFEYRYDQSAKTLFVFIDNGGEVGPKKGGKFDIKLNVSNSAVPGTKIENYATVYFPSVPEETKTNTVVSVVPKQSTLSYTGIKTIEFSNAVRLSAQLTDTANNALAAKSIEFKIHSSSLSAVTSDSGIGYVTANGLELQPGEYTLISEFAGDGYYYLPAHSEETFKVVPKRTVLSAPDITLTSSTVTTLTVTLQDNDNFELLHQQDEPKVVYLDCLVDDTWLTLAQAALVKSSATFEVSVPEKLTKLSCPLRARFNGDSRYRESTTEGKLSVIDAISPSIAISSPVAGAQYAVGASSIPVHFVIDDLDPAPTVYAFLTDLQKGTTVSVSNGEYIDPLSLDSGFWSLTVEATDWAGNTSSATVSGFEVVHDTQAPVITISSPREGDRYIAGVSTITVQYQVTDAVSGNPVVVSCFTRLVDGTTLQVTNGQTIDPAALTTGYWRLSVEAVDSAHNITSAVTGNFEVIHDLLPPVSKLVLSTPTYLTEDRAYVAPETVFSLTVVDDLNISGDGSGTGVQASYYAIDSSSFSLCIGTFTVSQKGEHSVYFYSNDPAGNRETPKTFKVFVDTAAPFTAITVTGPSADSSGKTVITGKTLFALVAADNGCGVSISEYRIDDSSWTTYVAPFGIALPDGVHTVSYCSTDNLNIRETAGTMTVIIDNTPPIISITQGISPTNVSTKTITGMYDDPNISTITVNGAAASIDTSNRTYSAMLILREGNNAIDVEALDLVGNIAVSTVSVVLDTVPPVLHVPDDLLVEATGDETAIVIGSATAVDISPVTITNDAPASYRMGTTSVTWTATDTAGNCSLSVQRVTVVDPTPPDVMVRISTPVYDSGSSVFINSSTDVELALAKAGLWIDKVMYTVNGIPQVYSAPFRLNAEENYTIVCYAVNKYGRSGPEKSFTVSVDTTPPRSNFRLSDAGCQTLLNGVLFVNGAANFILESIDPVSGGVCSGVRQMRCQIDNSEFRAISAGSVSIDLSSLPDGQHTINYYGIDNVDNSENIKSYTFVFDRTKPVVLSTFPQNNTRIRAKDIPAIKIVFSEPVWAANWADAVVVQEAKDRIIKDFAIVYDSAACTLTITGALKNNTVYSVTLLNAVTDRVSNKLDEFTFSFTTYLSAKEGGIVQNDNLGLTITAVPDALLCDGYFETNMIDGVTLPDLVNPLQWVLGDGKAYEIIFKDTDNNIVSEPLVQPIEIALSQQTGSLMLAPRKEESEPLTNLRLYQVGTAGDVQKAQYRAPGRRSLAGMLVQKLESVKGQPLTCHLTSLGLFSMAGLLAPGSSLGDLSCYPSPFNPNRETATIQYYLINASDVGIAVYDLLGNLVKTWKITAGDNGAQAGLNQLIWNGRNGADEVIANGGYIVSVHADGQNRKFKVLVVK